MFPSSIPASRNATTPSVETSTTDAYFLSWGSSVNVSEDLRRSIRSEIEEIDASIQSLESTINSETRTSMHLHKDLSHASFEMIGLRRSMGDELDAASMNEQVKKRMGETQKTEVVHPVSMATPLKSPVLSNGDGIPPDEINNNDTTKDHHGAERVTEAGTTHIIFLSKRTAEKEALARSILKDTGLLDQKNVLALSYEQESRAIQNRIEGDDLVRVLHEAEKEVEANKRDKEIELQRKRNTKEAVQYARTKCGGYAQQIADKTKELMWLKKNQAIQKDVMMKQQTEAEEEMRKPDSTVSLEAKSVFLSGDLNRLKGQLAQVTSIRHARLVTKQNRKEMQAKICLIKNRKNELIGKVADSKEKYDKARVALNEVQGLASSAEADKKINDTIEKEMFRPSQVEQVRLMKEKENLASIMSELGQKSQVVTKKSDGALVEVKTALRVIHDELKEVNEELNKAALRNNEVLCICKEGDATTRLEVDDLATFTSNVEQATVAEVSRMEALKHQKDQEREERVEETRLASAKYREELEEERNFYLQGFAIVDQASDAVSLLLRPVNLDEYDEN